VGRATYKGEQAPGNIRLGGNQPGYYQVFGAVGDPEIYIASGADYLSCPDYCKLKIFECFENCGYEFYDTVKVDSKLGFDFWITRETIRYKCNKGEQCSHVTVGKFVKNDDLIPIYGSNIIVEYTDVNGQKAIKTWNIHPNEEVAEFDILIYENGFRL
jgi:hypothetical protein